MNIYNKPDQSGFQLSVESNLPLLCFCIITLCDWLKEFTPLTQPITCKTTTRLARTRFPALGAGYMYLLQVLIGSLDCLRLL